MTSWDSFKILFANRILLFRKRCELLAILIPVVIFATICTQVVFRIVPRVDFVMTETSAMYNGTKSVPFYNLGLPSSYEDPKEVISLADFVAQSTFAE